MKCNYGKALSATKAMHEAGMQPPAIKESLSALIANGVVDDDGNDMEVTAESLLSE